MKKKITQIMVLAIVICTSAFAGKNDDKVNRNVLTEFTQKFSGAKEVIWSSTADYVKASFQLNEQYMAAYFTTTGEVVGIARNLTSNQLPIKLQSELKNNLSGSWISELFEYSTDEEITYCATIESADQSIVVKSVGSNWTLIKKTRKN